jgi:hypothetical protein
MLSMTGLAYMPQQIQKGNADWIFGSCARRSTSSASALIDTRSWTCGTRTKRQGRMWLVFYSERGARRDLQRFASELAACQYLIEQLRAIADRLL